MNPERWLRERTYPAEVDLDAVLAAKSAAGDRVSVVIPALNVAGTIGAIVTAIRERWAIAHPLVDEVIVVDSHSHDGTGGLAAAAGATVYQDDAILPETGRHTGKGEAMWKSLHVARGDIILWVDGDIVGFDPGYVPAMLAPLLTVPEVVFVKAAYGRMLDGRPDGGRVTEICARPLLNLFRPELTVVAQPLAGEQAGRRNHLRRLPFLTGYAVEMGLLLDTHTAVGLEGIAQVELPARHHTNQTTVALGRMAYAVSQAVLTRAGATAGFHDAPFERPVSSPGGWRMDRTTVAIRERPPMAMLDGPGTG